MGDVDAMEDSAAKPGRKGLQRDTAGRRLKGRGAASSAMTMQDAGAFESIESKGAKGPAKCTAPLRARTCRPQTARRRAPLPQQRHPPMLCRAQRWKAGLCLSVACTRKRRKTTFTTNFATSARFETSTSTSIAELGLSRCLLGTRRFAQLLSQRSPALAGIRVGRVHASQGGARRHRQHERRGADGCQHHCRLGFRKGPGARLRARLTSNWLQRQVIVTGTPVACVAGLEGHQAAFSAAIASRRSRATAARSHVSLHIDSFRAHPGGHGHQPVSARFHGAFDFASEF